MENTPNYISQISKYQILQVISIMMVKPRNISGSNTNENISMPPFDFKTTHYLNPHFALDIGQGNNQNISQYSIDTLKLEQYQINPDDFCFEDPFKILKTLTIVQIDTCPSSANSALNLDQNNDANYEMAKYNLEFIDTKTAAFDNNEAVMYEIMSTLKNCGCAPVFFTAKAHTFDIELNLGSAKSLEQSFIFYYVAQNIAKSYFKKVQIIQL